MAKLDRDEILRRAQTRKGEDELAQQVEERASRNGIAAGAGVFLLLFVLNHFAGQPSSDLSAILFLTMAVMYLYKWHRLGNRLYCIVGISSFLSGLLSLVVYLRQLFF